LFYQSQAQARRYMVLAFLPMYIIRPVVTALLIITCWRFTQLAPSALLVLQFMACAVAAAVVPQILVYRHRDRQLPTQEPENEPREGLEAKNLWPSAMPILRSRIAGLTIEYSSILILTLFAGPASTGLFFAAERLARLAALPLDISRAVVRPRIASAHATNDFSAMQHGAYQVAHISFWPTLFLIVCLFIFAQPVVGLFGDEYTAATSLLFALLAAQFIRVSAGGVDELLLMSGNQALLSRVTVRTAVLHVVLLLLLVPTWGALGAVFAIIVSTGFRAVSLLLLVRRVLAINPTVLNPKFLRGKRSKES